MYLETLEKRSLKQDFQQTHTKTKLLCMPNMKSVISSHNKYVLSNFTEVQVSRVIIVLLLQNCFVWCKDQCKPYSSINKKCSLCLNEKFIIICKKEPCSLNRRNELASSCPHRNQYVLGNFRVT